MARIMADRRRNPDLDREIDDSLKRAFDKLASEPVPDRFTALLDRLRASGPVPRDAASSDGGAGDE